jgi:hypothetical protein
MTIEQESLTLAQHHSGSGVVEHPGMGEWRFTIPAGQKGIYRLAQVDDYISLSRRQFPWQPPLVLELEARVSNNNLPGTWGFGFWNDPFAFTLGLGGAGRRLPVLPNCVWYFFASASNHLAFRDGHPAQGLLSAVFSSPRIPAWMFAPVMPAALLLAWSPTARLLRKFIGRVVGEDAQVCDVDMTQWRHYRLEWHEKSVCFVMDHQEFWKTNLSPQPPLGLVIWIDNQFAAFPPNGKVSTGTLANPEPAWMEIRNLSVKELN